MDFPDFQSGGSIDADKEPQIIQVAIQNALAHGIHLHHGVPNLANGDCIFESVADNITTRSCFHEVLNESPEHYRKIWLNEVEDLVLQFSGYSENVFHEKWQILKIPGNYEYELGDYVLPAISLYKKRCFDFQHEPK